MALPGHYNSMVKRPLKKSVSPKRKYNRVLRKTKPSDIPPHLQSFPQDSPLSSVRIPSRLSTHDCNSGEPVREEARGRPSPGTSSKPLQFSEHHQRRPGLRFPAVIGKAARPLSTNLPSRYKETNRCLALIKYIRACNLAGLPVSEKNSGDYSLLYQIVLLKSKLSGDDLPSKTTDRSPLEYCNICWKPNASALETIRLCCGQRFHCVCLVAWIADHPTCPTCLVPVSFSK